MYMLLNYCILVPIIIHSGYLVDDLDGFKRYWRKILFDFYIIFYLMLKSLYYCFFQSKNSCKILYNFMRNKLKYFKNVIKCGIFFREKLWYPCLLKI